MIYLLSIASGILIFLSAPPLPLWPLVWVAFVPLFVAILRSKGYGQAIFSSALASITLHGFLFVGIANYSLRMYLLTLALYTIPFLILGAFTFFAAGYFKNSWVTAMSVASLWFLVEKGMSAISLPYGVGLLLYNSPWAGTASVVGCTGLGALIIFANTLMAASLLSALRGKIRPRAAIASASLWLAIVIIPCAYGWLYSSSPNDSSAGRISISIVQPNWAPQEYIGEAQKGLWVSAADYIKKAAADSPDVILFPESFGVYFDRQEELLDDLKGLPVRDIIIGGVKYDSDRLQTYNSVYQIRPGQGIVSVYDKGALIPLIETAYAAGANDAQSFSIDGRRFLPLVCFESLLESRFRDRQRDSEGFLLLANETWFNTRTLPFLHIASLVMRSIEYGRPSAMAGNTISMVSDPRGRFETTGYRQEEIARFNFYPQSIETIYGKLNCVLPYFAALFAFGPLSLRRARR